MRRIAVGEAVGADVEQPTTKQDTKIVAAHTAMRAFDMVMYCPASCLILSIAHGRIFDPRGRFAWACLLIIDSQDHIGAAVSLSAKGCGLALCLRASLGRTRYASRSTNATGSETQHAATVGLCRAPCITLSLLKEQ